MDPIERAEKAKRRNGCAAGVSTRRGLMCILTMRRSSLFQLEHGHGLGKDWFEGAKGIWGDCGTARFMISRRDFKVRQSDGAYMIRECS